MGYKTTTAQLRNKLGERVYRAAGDVVTGGTVVLYNIVGGRVLLTHLSLVVSAFALDAGANNANIQANPTVGATMNLCANLDIVAGAIGAVFSITGNIGDPMTGAPAGGGAMAMVRPIVINTGTIDFVSAANSGAGGALLDATLYYVPLDEGAYVTAA
jgi:hypothetical protein